MSPIVVLPVAVVLCVYALLAADLLILRARVRRHRRRAEAMARSRAAHPARGDGDPKMR